MADKASGHPKGVPKRGARASPEDVIAQRQNGLEQRRTIVAFLLKLGGVALVLWVIFTYAFGVAAMSGETHPRIRDGDLMLFYRLERVHHIGDVLTFTTGGTRYTGRIVAMGGDTVDMSDAGELLVNGNIQSEDTVYPTYKADATVSFPYTVEPDSVFLLCDLRTGGTDSRVYGAVANKDIDGKIITILRRRGI